VPGKVVLYVMAALTVFTLLVLSAIHARAPHSASDWLSPVGPAVTIAGVGLWVFDRYAWRRRGVRRLVSRPLLHGSWHGELASGFEKPGTDERIPTDTDVFLVIRQRFWQVTARLLTQESESASSLASFVVSPDGVQQLIWVYRNTPRTDVRDRSEVHHGAVVMGAPRDPTDGLRGHYFTDRKTRGDLRFNRRYNKLVETHAAGRALVEASG
jgi:hypothetical protein